MPRVRRAFTLIELLVVVSIIVIVLLIALPGLNAMSADMRKHAAAQQIETVLSRAQNLAIERSTLTAVRFLPAAWDAAADAAAADKQRMVIYEYVGATERWDGNAFQVEFNEYFKRAHGPEPVDLPEGTWVAPLESLDRRQGVKLQWDRPDGSSPPRPVTQSLLINDVNGLGAGFVLFGTAGAFACDPVDGAGGKFLNADDFIVVFDPRNGLLAGSLRSWRILGYSPTERQEVDRNDPIGPNEFYQRIAFGGLIIYPREHFVAAAAAGNDTATALARQKVLAEYGQPYAITRFGGQLTDAGGAAP